MFSSRIASRMACIAEVLTAGLNPQNSVLSRTRFGWRHRTSLNLIVSYLRSSGHLVASLGLAIRVNRDWLPHLRPKTGGGCTIGLRLGFNDLSLFRIRHYSARHSRNYAYCYSLFRQVLNHVKLGLRFKRSQMIGPAETPAAKRSVESTERI
jgi:hypothetical protein